MANKKKSSIIKWIVIGVAIVALGVGGFFGYKAYENYLANKSTHQMTMSVFLILTLR